MIPRAIITAVAFGAVFYVSCVTVQTLGFGTSAAGVSAFRHSQAPLGELARLYVGTPLAAALDLGAALSALGAGARRGDRRRPDDVRVRARRAGRPPP
jgi:amino acid transporter